MLALLNRASRKSRSRTRARRRRTLESLEPRCLLATLGGEVFVDDDGDGLRGPAEEGAAGVRVYVDANNNKTLDSGEIFDQTDALGSYVLTGVPANDSSNPVTHIRVEAPRGQLQSTPTAFFGSELTNTQNATQLFQMNLDGTVQTIGSPANEIIHDIVRIADGSFLGVNSLNDSIYRIDPDTGQETRLSQADTDISAGIALDPVSDNVYILALDQSTSDTYRLHTVDPASGQISNPIGDGLSGITAVDDLAFDGVNGRIVGFNDANDQFFEFRTDGTAQHLATANRSIDSLSLAFDGSSFVMFDQGDFLNRLTVEVNPDTGNVVDGVSASRGLQAQGLFHAKRGDVAHQLVLDAGDVEIGLDFGLATPITTSQRVEDHPTVINEIMVGFRFDGDADTDQFLEFRGRPGGQLNPGTYFVIVDDQDINAGEIHGIFDLSNQQLGANGFLTILQKDSPHVPHPDSAVLQSITDGFGALPGGIYTDSHTLSDRIDFILGSNTYFLIETDIPPQLGDDIDTDDDGFADPGGVKANWDVLDSVSLHPEVFTGGQAYGQILLAEEDLGTDPNTVLVEPGTPIVVTNGFGYAGRIGDSVGSSPDDWVFGTPVEAAQDPITGRTTVFELENNFFGYPSPRAFARRDIDHPGESNFVGGVRGTVDIEPGIGETDPAGNPLPIRPGAGLTVLADTNGNGTRDQITYVVEPDFAVDFSNLIDPLGNEVHFPLTNFFPGVSISAVDDTNEPFSSEIETARETINFFTPTNNFLFAYQGIDQFDSFRRLRFDFYEPVSEVSVDALGSDFGFLSPSYGLLEAYDADDQLITSSISGLLVGQRRETVTVTSENHDIAYVVAYPIDDPDDPGINFAWGRFDTMTFSQLEPAVVTDSNGQFEIKNLFPGLYDVSVMNNAQSNGLIGGVPQQYTVSRYENYLFNETLRPNTAPQVSPDVDFVVDENLPENSSIGFVTALDLDRQSLTFEILEGAESGLLIDSLTGQITVGPDAAMDFEETPVMVLTVGVSDALTTTTTEVTVTLNDLNEAPIVEEAVFFVAEHTPDGTTIGQVDAVDPDTEQGQMVIFEIIGGSGAGIFEINAANGLITLLDESAINFETLSELVLDVRVSDTATPPLFTDIQQRIRVLDQNDLPTLTTTEFQVNENSEGEIGTLQVSDPDTDQTHVFELLGGTGAGLFDVFRDGRVAIREGAEINFEDSSSYTLEVIAIDSGAPPLAAEGTVTISVIDLNEPPYLEPSGATLPENSPADTEVAVLTIVDPEDSGEAYTATLLEQGDAGNFDFDPTTNTLTVADGADLNFEINPTQMLTFEITDPSGVDGIEEVTFIVELTDENDPPIVLTEELILSELAVPGTVVGKVEVQVVEPDIGDEVTAVIIGGSAQHLFSLDPNTRVLVVADGATFDADVDQDPLTIEVEATDAAGATDVGTITMILNDVNEPPVFIETPEDQTVVSGEDFSMVIPLDSIVDPEGRPYSLTVFDSNDSLPEWLTFDEDSRTLFGLADPTLVGDYPLTLRAFEPGPIELFNDAPFTITVELGETPRTNQRNRLDVDANSDVAALDALRIINYISRYGNGSPATDLNPFTGFVDTSGDGFVTTRDALLVINGLGEQQIGVGEQIIDDLDERNQAVDDALTDLLDEISLF